MRPSHTAEAICSRILLGRGRPIVVMRKLGCSSVWRRYKELRCKPDAGKLPTRFGRKEVAIRSPDVGRGRDAGTAAQDKLAAHELAVIFAQRAGQRTESRIAEIGAGGPFPAIAKELRGALECGRSALEKGFG